MLLLQLSFITHEVSGRLVTGPQIPGTGSKGSSRKTSSGDGGGFGHGGSSGEGRSDWIPPVSWRQRIFWGCKRKRNYKDDRGHHLALGWGQTISIGDLRVQHRGLATFKWPHAEGWAGTWNPGPKPWGDNKIRNQSRRWWPDPTGILWAKQSGSRVL